MRSFRHMFNWGRRSLSSRRWLPVRWIMIGLVLAAVLSPAEVLPPNGPGSALEFDGVNDRLSANGVAMPIGNSAYTIEAWIKPSHMHIGAIAGWGIQFGSSANVFRLTPTGLVNYWWDNDLYATAPSLAGAWHHVAATFDGITRRILVDGVVLALDNPGSPGAIPSTFWIGSAFGGEFFSGQIDEVRIWDVGRSAAQIRANLRRQLVGNEPH